MKLTAYILALLLPACAAVAADVSFDFVKTTVSGGRTETVCGTVYEINAGSTTRAAYYMRVTSPVSQYITDIGPDTYIYYPEQKKAYILQGNASGRVSFDPFRLVYADLDFKKMGFVKKEKKEASGGTVEEWLPRNLPGSQISRIRVRRDRYGRLTGLSQEDADGKTSMEAQFSGYREFAGKVVPSSVKSYVSGKDGAVEERFDAKNFSEKPALPDMVKDFRLPKDTSVKKYKVEKK